MKTVFVILSPAIACAIVIVFIAVTGAKSAEIHRYRRPDTVLLGISPTKTIVFRCHNFDHDLPRVFGFGGCKEIHR